MAEFRIEMRKTLGLTDGERRRRLHQAYTILLQAAQQKETALDDEFGDQAPNAASDAPTSRPDALGSIAHHGEKAQDHRCGLRFEPPSE